MSKSTSPAANAAALAKGRNNGECDRQEVARHIDEARRLVSAARMAAAALEEEEREAIQKVLELAEDELAEAHDFLGFDR